MLRWFPRFQVATACFSCSPPDLNFLDPYFKFMYMHNNHCHQVTAHLQLNVLFIYVFIYLFQEDCYLEIPAYICTPGISLFWWTWIQTHFQNSPCEAAKWLHCPVKHGPSSECFWNMTWEGCPAPVCHPGNVSVSWICHLKNHWLLMC